MNGRVYDPVTGRFLSADPPHIQAPYDTQSYNRYTYVKNNPLKYTNPSGFFFKKIFKAVKKYIKVIIAVVVTVVVAIYAPYLLGFTKTIGLAALSSLTLGQAMIIGAISCKSNWNLCPRGFTYYKYNKRSSESYNVWYNKSSYYKSSGRIN